MRKIIILSIIGVLIFSVGCSDSKDENSIEENNVNVIEEIEEKHEYITFNSLGNIYSRNEDITIYSEGDEVFNEESDNPYANGRYMEVDFAKDLIERYLQGDESIFDYLVTIDDSSEEGFTSCTNDEKNVLKENLNFLREQMYLQDGDPVYFRLSKVNYEGSAKGIENSIVLKVTGHLSVDNSFFASLSQFTVTVIQKEDKLLANIF